MAAAVAAEAAVLPAGAWAAAAGEAAAVDSVLPGDLLLALGRGLADTARPGWAALAGAGRWALRPLPAPGGAGEVAFPAR